MDCRSIKFMQHFDRLLDHRDKRKVLYPLKEIILVSVCAILCGAETWEQIELFGNERKAWLKKYLELKNGIPHYITFRRLFSTLSPDMFEECFLSWVNTLRVNNNKEVISIDGKSLRGSYTDTTNKKGMLHLVSAWASENELILGQIKTADKSNEITVIPLLINKLIIENCIITIDASGCQRNVAKKIIDKKADYILSLKKNQETLYDTVKAVFNRAERTNYEEKFFQTSEDSDFGHGRIEKRKCTVLPFSIYSHDSEEGWEGLKTVIKIDSERVVKSTGESSTETRYFISSLEMNADRMKNAIRKHWGVEIMHWHLDVTFKEDNSKTRIKNEAQNQSAIRRMCINLLKRDKTKLSMKNKTMKALMSDAYLEKILSHH